MMVKALRLGARHWYLLLLFAGAVFFSTAQYMELTAKMEEGWRYSSSELFKMSFYLAHQGIPFMALAIIGLFWIGEYSGRQIGRCISAGMNRSHLFWSKVIITEGLLLYSGSLLPIQMFFYVIGRISPGEPSIENLIVESVPAILFTILALTALTACLILTVVCLRGNLIAILLPGALFLFWDYWRLLFGEDNMQILMLGMPGTLDYLRIFFIPVMTTPIASFLAWRIFLKTDFR